jgi:murein DD-endopeptidase MepM/ murein hydrolase activator NlpD
VLRFRVSMRGTSAVGGGKIRPSRVATVLARGRAGALLGAIVLATARCADSPSAPTAQMRRDCPGPYPDQATSPYVLPWEVGRSFRIWQGSCGNDSHRAGTFDQYAYDFQMPIGTPVLAARAGRVFRLGSERTGLRVEVLHDDDTVAAYLHLTRPLVSLDDAVTQAQAIGLSGHPNLSAPPHLHFHLRVRGCDGCRSLPVTFRNTRAHPQGLTQAETYTALPFQSSRKPPWPPPRALTDHER